MALSSRWKFSFQWGKINILMQNLGCNLGCAQTHYPPAVRSPRAGFTGVYHRPGPTQACIVVTFQQNRGGSRERKLKGLSELFPARTQGGNAYRGWASSSSSWCARHAKLAACLVQLEFPNNPVRFLSVFVWCQMGLESGFKGWVPKQWALLILGHSNSQDLDDH